MSPALPTWIVNSCTPEIPNACYASILPNTLGHLFLRTSNCMITSPMEGCTASVGSKGLSPSYSKLVQIITYKRPASIHDLDSFILLKIFSYLNVKDQLTCLRTCCAWRELLQRGGQRLQQLSVCFQAEQPVLELSCARNEGQKLSSESLFCTNAHPAALFTKHQLFARVHTLVLSFTFVTKTLQLDLSNLTSLKQLEIHGTDFELSPHLPLHSVRHLYVEEWRPEFAALLPSLQTLTLNTLIPFDEEENSKLWQQSLPALSQSPNFKLKDLHLNNVQLEGKNSRDQLTKTALDYFASYAQNLNRLSLSLTLNQNARPARHFNTFKSALQKFKKLQTLNLQFDLELNVSCHVYNFMWELLNDLQTKRSTLRLQLQLRFENSLDGPFFDAQEDMGSKLLHFERYPNLESLVVNGHSFRLPCYQLQFLKHIGVRALHLKANDWSLLDCKSIGQYLAGVESLWIEHECLTVEKLNQLPTLKEVYFDCPVDEKLLIKLSTVCPNLECLSFEYWTREMDMYCLANFSNLRSLFLRSSPKKQITKKKNYVCTSANSSSKCNLQTSKWTLVDLFAACPQLCNINIDGSLWRQSDGSILLSCAQNFLYRLRINAFNRAHLFHHLHLNLENESCNEQQKTWFQQILQQVNIQKPTNLYVSVYS